MFGFWYMVFNATFNNISVISWRSVLLVEETRVPGENHRPVASNWQTLSRNVVLSTLLLLKISQRSDLCCYGWLYCRPLLSKVCQTNDLCYWGWLYCRPLLFKVCQRSNLCCCDWLYHRPLLFNVCKKNNSCNCVLLYCLSVMFNFLFSIYYFNQINIYRSIYLPSTVVLKYTSHSMPACNDIVPDII
jgi:hypothetical protein